MKRDAYILPVVFLIVCVCGLLTPGDCAEKGKRPYQGWSSQEFPWLRSSSGRGSLTAPATTYTVVSYDFFDEYHIPPEPSFEEWERIDHGAQLDTFWHVEDYAGLLDCFCDYPGPLEGERSMWCGTRADPGDPYTCSWACPNGYGQQLEPERRERSDPLCGHLDILLLSPGDNGA